jgi:threonine aldolase
MDALKALAGEAGLPVHLDGARIFNAALVLGVDARKIAARADSVMFCLSKGLCAPVGSLLAGPEDFVREARYKRKIMGGGMRQAGILAAAGLIALRETGRLAEDHRRAKDLAHALAAIPGLSLDVDKTEINLVFFSFPPAKEPGEAQRITEFFAQRNILINSPDEGVFRFATHRGVGEEELALVQEACKAAFTGADR